MARKTKPTEGAAEAAAWPALGSRVSASEAIAALDRVVDVAINSGKANTGDLIAVASLRAHLGGKNPEAML